MEEARKTVVNLVTANSAAYLANFFAALDAQTEKDFTVTVVDNASDDGTVKRLQEERPDVTVLRNFRDQGAARAANQAIALALTRWPEAEWPHRHVMICAPNIEMSPGCLAAMVSALDSDEGLAAACPKILYSTVTSVGEDGHREAEYSDAIDSCGLEMRKSRRIGGRGRGQKDKGQYGAAADVFGAPGICGLFRASSLAECRLNGDIYDEDFGSTYLDADLAWRMRRFGLRVRFVPEAVAYVERTMPQNNRRISERNRLWLAWKNDSVLDRLAHSPWILGRGFVICLTSVFSPAAWRGRIGALAGLLKMEKKSKDLKRRSRIKGEKLRAWYV